MFQLLIFSVPSPSRTSTLPCTPEPSLPENSTCVLIPRQYWAGVGGGGAGEYVLNFSPCKSYFSQSPWPGSRSGTFNNTQCVWVILHNYIGAGEIVALRIIPECN